jgi:lysophospholipase L1-like esterase
MSRSELTLVYMGDSITFGQYLEPSLRWSSVVNERLEQEFPGAARSLNHGISGETTRIALERFPRDVQAHSPRVMTLQFGLNDCNRWNTDKGHPRVSPDAFKANLREMIDRARLFGAEQIVLSTNHPTLRRTPIAGGESFEAGNVHYNELIRQIAADKDVTLCDIARTFADFDDDALAGLLLPPPDILHLSAEGNQVYADAIWPYVRRAVAITLGRKGVQIPT